MCSKRYLSAIQNKEKKKIAGELFNFIHLQGGRFLKKVEEVMPGDGFVDSKIYCEADEAVALEKCKQTLRDHVEKGKPRPNGETNLSLLGGSEGSFNFDSYIGTGTLAMAMNERRILSQQDEQDGALRDPSLASSFGSIGRVASPNSLNSHSSLSTMKKSDGGDDLMSTFLPAKLNNTEVALSAAPLRCTMPRKVGHTASFSSPSKGWFPSVGSEACAASSASMLESAPFSHVADRQGLDPRMQALLQQCQQVTKGSLPYLTVGLGSMPQLRPNPGLNCPTPHYGTRLLGDMKRPDFQLAPNDASQKLHPSSDPEEEEEVPLVENIDDDNKEGPKQQYGDISESFPKKLYRMLEEAQENGQEDVLSFSSNGRAFAIHKPHKFVKDILPRYSSTTRMSSFHRQLSLYGFRRVSKGLNRGYHYHKFFLKGRKGLVNKIKRKVPVRPKPTKVDLEESIVAFWREMSGADLGILALNFTTYHLSRQQELFAQSQMINRDEWPSRLGNNLSRLPPGVMDVLSDPSVQYGNAAMRSHSFASGNGLRIDPTIAILLEEHKQSELRIAPLQQRRKQMLDLFRLIS
jgi:hypothetical protein